MSAWIAKALGALCDFQRGLTYGKTDEVEASGTVVLRANNVDLATNTLDLSDLRYISDLVAVPAAKRLRKGSLLICTASGSKSHLGKIAYIDNDYGYAFGGFMGQITPTSGVESRYLFHVLTSPAYRTFIAALSDGANINNLKFDDLRRFPVPLPAISEQRRIVAILDEAFEAIATAKANAEKNLQNVQALFRSHRESLLSGGREGWSDAPLSDLCDIKHGYAFEGEFFAKDGDHVLLTPGNYFEAGGYRDRGEKQKYYTGPIPRDFVLSEGDLLVAMTEQASGLLGSPLLVPESDRFLHNQRLGLVKAKPGVEWANEFFFHVFNLARVRAEIHASASGVKVRHTSPGKIGAVGVAFPKTVAEQRQIAASLNRLAGECDQLQAIYDRKLAALDELKQSLLHQAFTGALTARSADQQLATAA
jgi:type I restriction enzyme S subunit